MSRPSTPRWAVEELEVPEIHDSDDLGELVRKLSLCVPPYSCSTLHFNGVGSWGYAYPLYCL